MISWMHGCAAVPAICRWPTGWSTPRMACGWNRATACGKSVSGRGAYRVDVIDPAGGQAGCFGVLDENGRFALVAARPAGCRGTRDGNRGDRRTGRSWPMTGAKLNEATHSMYIAPLLADVNTQGFGSVDPGLSSAPARPVSRQELLDAVDGLFPRIAAAAGRDRAACRRLRAPGKRRRREQQSGRARRGSRTPGVRGVCRQLLEAARPGICGRPVRGAPPAAGGGHRRRHGARSGIVRLLRRGSLGGPSRAWVKSRRPHHLPRPSPTSMRSFSRSMPAR